MNYQEIGLQDVRTPVPCIEGLEISNVAKLTTV
ncbi:hypothetical protein FNP_1835 [Fusobacterium polymorphum ATCC 10953]|uniref:Uncharacterized protein n=1 Tax=Fusobacterium polymorphum ATCC 10953 TaxID=393480 RepID=A5TXI2_FUSNP|nr:hypothetical protein FNP_1835 [Fusobacterium polymorphum ATCC 10953]